MKLTFFCIALASAQAFVATRTHRPATSALQSENGSGMARMFGLVAAVSVFSLSSPPSVALDSQVPAGRLSIAALIESLRAFSHLKHCNIHSLSPLS